MHIDLMVGPSRWDDAAELARTTEAAGFSGMLFTETGQTPWMSMAAAAMAAPSLTLSTGIAVAFPVSPMVMASIAWELADNTGDFAIIAEFDSVDDYRVYATDERHVEIIQTMIAPNAASIARCQIEL